LQAVQEEVDLGIIVQDNLKWASQCAKVVGKANKTLGFITIDKKMFWKCDGRGDTQTVREFG
jgi:hypothetical protein